MVKKFMRLRSRRISIIYPVLPAYESMGTPRLAVPHCLFPEDDVPFGVEYRVDWRGERQVERSKSCGCEANPRKTAGSNFLTLRVSGS